MDHRISTLMFGKLKRILFVTLSISAVLILLFTLFSFKQRERQAAQFVMNHVERLAQVGVNSQNVNNIDLEIARFAQTWKETQDLDLRIDISLNEKLVSHAGQLHPFGILSTRKVKQINLSSGDTMLVELQFDLLGAIASGFIFLLVLECSIICLFYLLRRSMQVSINSVTAPLESKIAWLKEIAHDLPVSAQKTAVFERSGITEIDDLGESIGSLTRQIVLLEENLAKINFDRGRIKMAKQVAHNIKGIIATLQLRVARLAEGEERAGLSDCIETLQGISSDLLKSKPDSGINVKTSKIEKSTNPLAVAQSVIYEKRAQLTARQKISIQLCVNENFPYHLVPIQSAILKSVLSNLIDNSVDAIGLNQGRIELKTESTQKTVRMELSDTGCGIPANILPLLMTEGFSYGKKEGNGIGLSHAKEVIEAAQGSIAIGSKDGLGTTVKIELPWINSSQRPVEEIFISESLTIICVDDDPLIHSTWKSKFRDISSKLLNMIHLVSVSELENWFAIHGQGEYGSRLYLVDFDLKDSTTNGLDLIEKYGIAFESILVSGMVNDTQVQKRLSQMGIRFLDKDSIHKTTICMNANLKTETKEMYLA